jgi:hypothetical protein
MELPSHPEANEPADREPATTSWAAIALVVLVIALLAVIVLLHLTGVVGPSAH